MCLAGIIGTTVSRRESCAASEARGHLSGSCKGRVGQGRAYSVRRISVDEGECIGNDILLSVDKPDAGGEV